MSNFKSYQSSKMCTTELQMLEKLVQIIKRLGGTEYMMADDLEKLHNQFKNYYRKTSKRKVTTMSDTVKLQQEYLHTESIAAREESEWRSIKLWKVNTQINKNNLCCYAV